MPATRPASSGRCPVTPLRRVSDKTAWYAHHPLHEGRRRPLRIVSPRVRNTPVYVVATPNSRLIALPIDRVHRAPLFASLYRSVGRLWNRLAPRSSRAVGVASNNEESRAAVRESDVGRANNTPSRIEPQLGKRPKDTVESQRQMPLDVLKDDVPRPENPDPLGDVGEDVSLVIFSSSCPRERERLARVPRSQHVHSRD